MKLAPLKIAVVAAVAAALVAGSSAAFGALRGGSASARTVKTGVVVVNTRLATGGAAAGTGIVVASDEVLTNNHVIRGASAVRVTDPSSGRTFAATVAGYSVTRDIALLDACRRKRHIAVYDQVGAVSDQEADEMLQLAKRLRKAVEKWIRHEHRELLH